MFQELIDEMFLTDPDNKDRNGDMKIHPSAISGCGRNAIYAARGEKISDPRDVRFTRIMGNGSDYHAKLQRFIKAKYPDAIIEAEVKWGLIDGSADILMPGGEGLDTRWRLVELKTISPNGKRFIQGTKPKTLMNGVFKPGRTAEPKPEHVTQDRIYYMGLRRMGYKLEDTFTIVYIDRDDWSTLEFDVEPWDVDEEEAYLDKMATLQGHLFDGTLPERMPDDYWLCKLCEWRTVCKPEQYDPDRQER